MSDDKPHKCTHLGCEASFVDKTKLTRHLTVHSDERPFQCTYLNCSLFFKTKEELDKHTIRHNDERPFQCTYLNCFSSFKTKADLGQHMIVHTNERPFVCCISDCGFSFKTKQNLNQHMLVHSEERPFVCCISDCGLSFKTKQNLDQHMIRHSNERPFQCTYLNCGLSFKTKADLNQHQKRMHSEEGQQRQKKSETATYNSLLKWKLDLKREHQINVSCNGDHFYRIDYVHISNGVMFFIENDEHQHDHYPVSCEIRRMINTKSVLLQEGNNMPLVFIRYNPDVYRVDTQVKKTKKEDRIKQLVKLIQTISRQPGNCPPLSIYYLFYDMTNNEPTIFQDSEYVQEVKSLVKCIYE